MAELILGPMLRHVGETSATIWVETDGACTVDVLGTRATTFCVAGHFYALAIVDGLQPDTTTEYDVRLDGDVKWPAPGSRFPPSTIRTLPDPDTASSPMRILFGSCRTAAPHDPPWSLELAGDARGRGVDAIYAHARRMMHTKREDWPDLMVMLGDQI